MPWGSLLGIQIMWAFGNAVQPAGLSRCYLAKDSKTWIKGLLIATFAAITVAWLVVTAGSGVSLVNPCLLYTSSPRPTWCWGSARTARSSRRSAAP